MIDVSAVVKSNMARDNPSTFKATNIFGFVIQLAIKSVLIPALYWVKIKTEPPKEAKLNSKAIFLANLSPEKLVAKAPNNKRMSIKDTFIMYDY